MKPIEIDDEVLAELERRATGFYASPNDVLRRILELPPKSTGQLTDAKPPQPASTISTIMGFISSNQFQGHRQAIDRYLLILGWLHSKHEKQFAQAVLGFRRGNRVYFAYSEKEILESADGATVRQIPKSPFWALVTLDNKSKRLILENILHSLGYSRSDINSVLAVLPDSGIRRNHGNSRFIAELLGIGKTT